MRPYLTTHHCKRKHKPQVKCKMTVCKTTSYKRNAKNEKRTNLKEFPRPHKMPQRAPAESVKARVKLSKTCLPLVGPLCHSKVLKEGQPPQRHYLPTIGKEVGP